VDQRYLDHQRAAAQLASLRNFKSDLRLVQKSHDAHGDRLEQLIGLLDMQIADLCRRIGEVGPPPPRPDALYVDCQEGVNGSLMFSIDGGKEFTLPPRLEQFFQYIALGVEAPGGTTGPGRWLSRGEIAAYLERLAHRPFTFAYINEMVRRLRAALAKAGYDRMLIQTHRQRGIRLAVKAGLHGPPPRWGDDGSPSA
jgi:hypothetical protein